MYKCVGESGCDQGHGDYEEVYCARNSDCLGVTGYCSACCSSCEVIIGGQKHVHVDLQIVTIAVQASTAQVTCHHAQIVLPTPATDVRHARQFKNVPATPAIPDRMEEPVHNEWPAKTRYPKAVYVVTVHQANFRQSLVQ